MTGGMSRRYTFFQDLRKEGWPLVALDVGDLAQPASACEAEMKFHTLVESKEKMGYNAVGFGPNDLRLPAAELVLVAADVNGKPSMFVSANVGLFGFDQNITQTSRVVEAGGMRIGVTAILGKQYQKETSRQSRDRNVRSGSGLEEDRARIEAERRLSGVAGQRHAGRNRSSWPRSFPSSTSWLLRRGRNCRPTDAGNDPGNANAADYGRPQGDERDRAGLVRRRSRRSATSACRWIRDSTFARCALASPR